MNNRAVVACDTVIWYQFGYYIDSPDKYHSVASALEAERIACEMSLQNGGGVTGVFSGGEVVKLFCNGDEFVPFKI